MVETRYVRNGDVHLAYQVQGEGQLDLLELTSGVNISIDEAAEEPHWERYIRRLSSFSRLIRFDLRGVGLSDPLPPSEAPSLDELVEDALAVIDAAGAERVAVLGAEFGGAMGVVLAATHPERVSALVVVNSTARWIREEGYPYGFPAEVIDQWSNAITDATRSTDLPEELSDVTLYASSLSSDPAFRRWWSRAAQRGASPATAQALSKLYNQVDVRRALPSVSVPTLVVHRTEQFLLPIGHAQYLAERIPGAELVTLPGADTLPFSGNLDELVDPIEEFLTGERPVPAVDRALATIMFTDIVGSTERVAELGDRRWHDMLVSHDAMVGRQVERYRGRLIKRTGDGALVTFDGPARAIACATAIVAGARQLGIIVRVGLHSGEVDLLSDDVGGIAVHIAARVAAEAGAAEILVSRTVKDLVAGSDVLFEDRGPRSLRGVPGQWEVFAVRQTRQP